MQLCWGVGANGRTIRNLNQGRTENYRGCACNNQSRGAGQVGTVAATGAGYYFGGGGGVLNGVAAVCNCERMAAAEADIKNLIGWQESQNGSIKETRRDVNNLKYWIMGATLGVALNLVGVVFMLLKK